VDGAWAAQLRAVVGRDSRAPSVEIERKIAQLSAPTRRTLAEARECLQESRTAEAFEILERALARRWLRDPDRAALHQLYASGLAGIARYEPALAQLESALSLARLEPDLRRALRHDLGQLQVAAGRFEAAIATLEPWLAEAGKPAPESWYALAVAHSALGRDASALRAAQSAVTAAEAPREPWLRLLAALLLREGRYAEAVEPLSRLAEGFPRAVYWIDLARLQQRLGDPERAREALAQLRERELLVGDEEAARLASLDPAGGGGAHSEAR
jgi:tetratricopeptide (TPR) repeat protein